MTNTIWKFPLDAIDDTIDIDMPAELVRWLHVEPAGISDITLWAEVRPTPALPSGWVVNSHLRVFVRGTGHPMTGDEGTHIGTVVTVSGLVWHVFADDVDIEVGDED